MSRRGSCTRFPITLAITFFLVSLGAAWAQKETVLYSFCARNGCADGWGPLAGVALDQKGNLYGTTYSGGVYKGGQGYGAGVVFKLSPKGKYTVLHRFCSQGGDNCTDGAAPSASVVLDHAGNLYGTTYYGVANDIGWCCDEWLLYGCGVVFKITPKGEETILYNFCAQGGDNCTDGALPSAGLVLDEKGNFYGTTYSGGAYGGGVVFELTPDGKETVLYSFCARTNCLDGIGPIAGIVLDGKGNLYGTTDLGGAYGQSECSPDYGNYGCGVVFELTPQGTETVLHNFCAQNNCSDGAFPDGGVILDRNGNLYGTAAAGGNVNNGGVAFKLTRNGKEKVVYSFGAESGCADGCTPEAGLLLDPTGNLYGTTPWGGIDSGLCFPQGCGVVFRHTPQGKEQILYKFCTTKNCSDGLNPWAGLVFDQKGNMYGTAALGGAHNGCKTNGLGCGVIFKLTP